MATNGLENRDTLERVTGFDSLAIRQLTLFGLTVKDEGATRHDAIRTEMRREQG